MESNCYIDRHVNEERISKEINKLEAYLKDHDYVYIRSRNIDGAPQIVVYKDEEYKSEHFKLWDVIVCGDEGLLELMGSPFEYAPWDDGIFPDLLSAEDIIDMLENHEKYWALNKMKALHRIKEAIDSWNFISKDGTPSYGDYWIKPQTFDLLMAALEEEMKMEE